MGPFVNKLGVFYMAAKDTTKAKKTQNRLDKATWEKIERMYRANQLAVKDIADQFGTTPQAIAVKAKRAGWKRNLGRQVSQEIHRKVAEKMGGHAEGTEEYEEALIVEQASDLGINILTVHQSILSEHFELAKAVVIDLKNMRAGGKHDVKEWTIAHKNAVDTLAKLIQLDRQTYNIDEGGPDSDKEAKGMIEQMMESIHDGA